MFCRLSVLSSLTCDPADQLQVGNGPETEKNKKWKNGCIKILCPKDPEFYTPLALNCQNGHQLPAPEVYENQSPIFMAKFQLSSPERPPFTFLCSRANGSLMSSSFTGFFRSKKSGPEKAVIMKRVFSLEESLESLGSLENGRIPLCFPQSGSLGSLESLESLESLNSLEFIENGRFWERPLFQKAPFSKPEEGSFCPVTHSLMITGECFTASLHSREYIPPITRIVTTKVQWFARPFENPCP